MFIKKNAWTAPDQSYIGTQLAKSVLHQLAGPPNAHDELCVIQVLKQHIICNIIIIIIL